MPCAAALRCLLPYLTVAVTPSKPCTWVLQRLSCACHSMIASLVLTGLTPWLSSSFEARTSSNSRDIEPHPPSFTTRIGERQVRCRPSSQCQRYPSPVSGCPRCISVEHHDPILALHPSGLPITHDLTRYDVQRCGPNDSLEICPCQIGCASWSCSCLSFSPQPHAPIIASSCLRRSLFRQQAHPGFL